jgi:RNA polymerase sigma-70 factor (ECF subfamily)
LAQDTGDKALLKRVAEGDRAAMRSLYELHYDALHAFLRGRGADEQLASDPLQDAMLDVWRLAGRYNGKASVKTWIFTIARNKLVDRIRRVSRMSYPGFPK